LIEFYIPMKIPGKQRARVTKYGTYTPKETVNAEASIQTIAIGRMLETGFKKIERPIEVHVSIVIYRLPPKSWSKKKQKRAIEGYIRPTTKPDLDNQEKTIFDALSGVIYDDDSQITQKTISKIYWHVDGARVIIW